MRTSVQWRQIARERESAREILHGHARAHDARSVLGMRVCAHDVSRLLCESSLCERPYTNFASAKRHTGISGSQWLLYLQSRLSALLYANPCAARGRPSKSSRRLRDDTAVSEAEPGAERGGQQAVPIHTHGQYV